MNIMGINSMHRIFFGAAVLLFGVTICSSAAEEPAPFRVAVLHGNFSNQYGTNLHQDEFDAALKELNWPFDKFCSTQEDLDRLEQSLAQYDMAVVNPLFNYGYANAYLPIAYGDALADFVRNGGALMLTDAVYDSHVAWLPAIDPAMKLGLAGCESQIDAAYSQPPLSYNTVPNILRINRTFAHFQLPQNSRWEVIARCGSHNAPAVVAMRLGKGFVYATTFRHPNPQFLENMRANLELTRMGLRVNSFTMPKLNIGEGRLEFALTNQTDRAIDVRGTFTLSPERFPGKMSDFTGSVRIAPRADAVLTIPYDISFRGNVAMDLKLTGNDTSAQLLQKTVQLPDLLVAQSPRYRGMALEEELAKTGQLIVGAQIFPYRENPTELRLRTRAVNALGATVGEVDERMLEKLACKFPLYTGALPAGDYTIYFELIGLDGVLEQKKAPLKVMKESDCPVFINDEMNFLINGKPFFPIGIYHVPLNDYEQVAALGINTVQVWSWDGDSAVDKAYALGMHSIWEQNHRKNLQAVYDNAPKLKNKPGLLFWYSLDEPYEIDFPVAKAVTAAYHQEDAGHPTYMVSCRPELFPDHAATADIMAVDPYPYPSQKLTMVADWMDQAWQATKGDKPVICVPQSFGVEPEAEFRVMTYLGVIHGARGVIWYPWDDGGTTGMKYHPELQKACKKLTAELKSFAPALLNPEDRRMFLTEDGKIHGLFCKTPEGKHFLLLTNPEDKPGRLDLAQQPEFGNVIIVNEAFGEKSYAPDAKLTINPLETKVLTW